MKQTGVVTKVSGPVIHAKMAGAVNDLVRVGVERLLGEIIEVRGEQCVIQVYEDTTGVAPGHNVENTKRPLSVALGPGLLGQIVDGTQRPLLVMREDTGIFIKRGADAPALDQNKKWSFTPVVEDGQEVKSGEIIGTVKENSLIEHRILVPEGISGTISKIKEGEYTVTDTIAVIGKEKITMQQYWPVREARQYTQRYPVDTPLLTGQRVLDYMYPVAKGGVAAIPGPFGAGKTVTQQQVAKWCDADIIVYIGCGERGNEMTEVLEEFPHLKDPKSGEPLMNRTIIVANTSNMPVAAREASVYTGIAIAEYFRDQGYHVALMADSTSRWAEAMREISGRLEEMPGEEGYPAYLSKRLAEFYERAGIVETRSGRTGSVTIIGAVSPPGGDFSEPVTQNTLRLARCFWALDAKLADKRHFPSINWMNSYSLYADVLDEWYDENIAQGWAALRRRAAQLLQEEAELQEIVQLVGQDALPKDQQLSLVIARMIREDFLQQNAFHDEDTYCPPVKQVFMLGAIFSIDETARKQLDELDINTIRESDVAQFVAQLKYEENTRFEKDLSGVEKDFNKALSKLGGKQ